VAVEPLTPVERRELTGHFDAIEGNGLKAVRVLAQHPMPGVFAHGALVIDTLARAWRGVKGKGSGSDAWDNFVREFISKDFEGLYHDLRNLGLHNQSASSRIRFVSDRNVRVLHRRESGDSYFLHTEEFARDVETAFSRFRERALDDPEVGQRALSHFRRYPPVRAIPFTSRPARSASGSFD
jgi:hypothetical protein